MSGALEEQRWARICPLRNGLSDSRGRAIPGDGVYGPSVVWLAKKEYIYKVLSGSKIIFKLVELKCLKELLKLSMLIIRILYKDL